MSFLSELREDELSNADREALQLAAYFPTDAQIPTLRTRLGWEARKGDWFKERVASLYERFTDERHLESFVSHLARLGLDQGVVEEAVAAGTDARVGGDTADWQWSKATRREVLGALYWADLAERRNRRSGTANEAPPRLAELLRLPVHILDAALVRGWHHRNGAISDIETSVVGPRHATAAEAALANDVWATLSGADDTPTLYRVEAYQPVRVEVSGREALALRLTETNYRAFKGTNDVFQAADGRFADRAWSLGLGKAEMRDPADLLGSHLANPLSVTCIAYLRDRPGSRRRLMGIQNRNYRKVHSGRYCFQATAGGFVTVAGDTLRDDRPSASAAPDPFLTIAREFGEEAYGRPSPTAGTRSSAISPEDVTLLALVRDLASCWEIGLVGEIELPFTREDILAGRWQLGSDTFFEAEMRGGQDPIEWVEATPAGLARWLLDRGASIGDFMPFGLAAILLSFYHQGFSPAEIHAELRAVADDGKPGHERRHLLMREDRERRRDQPPRPDLTGRRLACWGEP